MRKITVKSYINRFFVGEDKPTERTVRNWIVRGDIPGVKIGGKWYIDLDQETTGNELADTILGLR